MRGLKNVAAGANPISLKLGMEKASQYLVMQINEFAQPVEEMGWGRGNGWGYCYFSHLGVSLYYSS